MLFATVYYKPIKLHLTKQGCRTVKHRVYSICSKTQNPFINKDGTCKNCGSYKAFINHRDHSFKRVKTDGITFD